MTPLTVPPWAILLAVTLVVIGVYRLTRKPRNRYRRSETPWDDPRCSIRNFKRMHQP